MSTGTSSDDGSTQASSDAPTSASSETNDGGNGGPSSSDPSQEGAATGAVWQREFQKEGWLKFVPNVEGKRLAPFSKPPKPEKFWVAFCVHNTRQPFLEFYDNRRTSTSHQPLITQELSQCLHVSRTIMPSDDDFEYEFAISLVSKTLRLAASSSELMVDWIDTLKSKLADLGIIKPHSNVYSKDPVPVLKLPDAPVRQRNEPSEERRSTARNPTSPLPPVPQRTAASSSAVSPSSSVVQESSCVTTPTNVPNVFSFEFVNNALQEASTSHHRVLPHSLSHSDSGCSSPATPCSRNRSAPDTPVSANTSPPEYEALYRISVPVTRVNSWSSPSRTQLISQHSRAKNKRLSYTAPNTPGFLPISVGPDRRNILVSSQPSGSSYVNVTNSNSNSITNSANASAQSLHLNVNSSNNSGSTSNSGAVPSTFAHQRQVILPLEENSFLSERSQSQFNGNVPVSSHGSEESIPRDLTLKELQILRLQREISHPSGVRHVVRKRDCVNAIAFVECFGHVWIAGWNQKDHPLLHNIFHIGDSIITVAGHTVTTVQETMKVIKTQALTVEFIVRRVPHGKAFAIKREVEGQELGLVREGGTAEIKEVRPDGLAAAHGLPLKASTVDGTNLCSWVLTEVNQRPLNLFFKNNEVQDRLNAVGKDISILVQPSDLVKTLKKQLKSLRSYKDYIVQ